VKVFTKFYERALVWSRHRLAPHYLGFLSFIEAIFFPVPPEVMLAPMTLARPAGWFRFASISVLGSMLGGFIGYTVGYFAIELVEPLLSQLGYAEKFAEVKDVAARNGFWFLLIGGFTPIPLKLLTLASGAVHMPLLPFAAGLLIGRAKRVYLVSGAIRLGGERAEQALHRWIEPIGWAALALLAGLVAWLVWYH
jgi:membrane protein YqaA with SNARE-associated domain